MMSRTSSTLRCIFAKPAARSMRSELYEKHLPSRPSLAGHNDYAYALLTSGRLAEGWKQYEFRWMRAPLLQLRPGFNRPVWGGQDLTGRVVLLRAEQGFGDIFQFVRYAPLVKAMGATVLLQVREGLERLARGFAGVDQVLDRSKSESLPHFDFYINLPSLPRVFNTTLESIPADIPYLHADPADVARWSLKLGDRGKLRVGLAWAGSPTHSNDRFRSMDLGLLKPVLEVAGVRFVSLQKGPAAQTAGMLPEGVDWIDAGAELEDFSDTAAVISELDLVLCVDTAVAHLAGALGKPVWVMVAQPADFRWLEGREDSPWYPTLRLFRQSRRDDWTDVVERVKAALEERVREGPAVMPAKTSVKAGDERAAAVDEPGAAQGGASAGDERGGGDAGRHSAVLAGRADRRRCDRLVRRVSAAATGFAGAAGAARIDDAGGGRGSWRARGVPGQVAGRGWALVPVRIAAGAATDIAAESGGQWREQRDGDAADAGQPGRRGRVGRQRPADDRNAR